MNPSSNIKSQEIFENAEQQNTENTIQNLCYTYAWRIFKVLYKSALDTVQYCVPFLVASVAAYVFIPCAALPLLTAAGSLFFTRVVARTIKNNPSETVNNLHQAILEQVYEFDKKYPKASTIALIFGVTLSPLSTYASATILLVYGIYTGIWMRIKKKLDNTEQANVTDQEKRPII